MLDKTWLRLGALCGGAAMVLLVVGNQVEDTAGGSPGLHEPADRYAQSLLSADQSTMLIGASLVVAGYLLLIPFGIALSSVLHAPSAPARLVTGGTTLTVAVALIGAAPLASAGVLAVDRELTPELAKALITMNAATWVLSWSTSAVWIAGAAAMILRSRITPAWMGWAGLALAVALPAASAVVWIAEALTLVWLVAVIWILVLSVTVAVRVNRWPALLGANAGTGASPRPPHPDHAASSAPGIERDGIPRR
jgi:Domain of unknown function (DUF4386)